MDCSWICDSKLPEQACVCIMSCDCLASHPRCIPSRSTTTLKQLYKLRIILVSSTVRLFSYTIGLKILQLGNNIIILRIFSVKTISNMDFCSIYVSTKVRQKMIMTTKHYNYFIPKSCWLRIRILCCWSLA